MYIKLILDSGATKTAWALVQGEKVLQRGQTVGLNPYFHTTKSIAAEITRIQKALPEINIHQIHFYGAGCRALDKKALMYAVWSQHFPQTHTIEIEDDISGTAKALCQKSAGIVCILGTGAAAALYDGKQIVHYAPSNGIWLGDEGSGAYLGKTLIQAYLNEELPKELNTAFEESFVDRRPQMLEKVYGGKNPSAYLGGFTPFLKSHQYHNYVVDLLEASFKSFFKRYIHSLPSWERYQVFIGGSTAFHFESPLRNIAKAHQVDIAKVSQAVLEGLIVFHQRNQLP